MEQKNQTVKEPQWIVSGYEWLSALISALVAVALVFMLLFRVMSVSGESMTDTFQNQDRLIMISRLYTIKRGDVVVINRTGEQPLIKRVIGLAGDVIAFDDETGIVTRNGVALDEPYVRGGFTPSLGCASPYTVPEGCIFAMGDNRPESKDSRMLGAFSTENVAGVVVLRLWPGNTAGWVRQIGYEGDGDGK